MSLQPPNPRRGFRRAPKLPLEAPGPQNLGSRPRRRRLSIPRLVFSLLHPSSARRSGSSRRKLLIWCAAGLLLAGGARFVVTRLVAQSRVRTLTVCVVTDFAYRDQKANWESTVAPLFERINRVFAKTRVQWQPILGSEVYSPADTVNPSERLAALTANACKADVVLGLSGQVDRGPISMAQPFSHSLLVEDAPTNTPVMTAILVSRSLANLFGAGFETRGIALAAGGDDDVFPPAVVTLIHDLRDYDFSKGVPALPGIWEARAAKALAVALAGKVSRVEAESEKTLARAFAFQRMYDDAVRHFRAAVHDDPTDPKVHFEFAMALQAAAQTTEAIAELRQAANLDPDNALYHAVAGSILLNNGHIDPAVDELRTAAQMEPRNATYQAALGKALAAQPGSIRDALAAFDKAVHLKPMESGAFSGLLSQQSAEQRYAEDLRAAQAELSQKPSSPAAHLKAGETLILTGDLDAAEKELRRTIEMDPSNGDAHLVLARTYYMRRQYREADAEIRSAKQAGVKPPTALVEAVQHKSAP